MSSHNLIIIIHVGIYIGKPVPGVHFSVAVLAVARPERLGVGLGLTLFSAFAILWVVASRALVGPPSSPCILPAGDMRADAQLLFVRAAAAALRTTRSSARLRFASGRKTSSPVRSATERIEAIR